MNPEQQEKISAYLKEEKILIVEPSASFQRVLAKCMSDMGAKPENIICTKAYSDAFNALFRHKPRIVLSEFFIDERHGLSLVDIQSQFYDDSKKIAILTTHNALDSAVAEAAEGHVDDYVLKPFPIGILRARISSIVLKKIKPSDYIQKINDGKRLLSEKEFDKAAKEFNEAASLNNAPALAVYYGGYTRFLQSQYNEAVTAYRKSRSIQHMHYKSVMGEFEALYEQKKYAQAFEMVPMIKSHFPISPSRLGSIVIAAVYSQNFSQLRELLKLYLKFENPFPEVGNIFAAAFMTAGKTLNRQSKFREARESFELGLRVLGPDTEYIDKCVREFVKVRAADDALVMLQKYPAERISEKSYLQLKFLVDQFFDETYDHIEKGRKLVSGGFADEDCFRLLLQVLVDMKKHILADQIAISAVAAYPELRAEFYKILEN